MVIARVSWQATMNQIRRVCGNTIYTWSKTLWNKIENLLIIEIVIDLKKYRKCHEFIGHKFETLFSPLGLI